MATCNTHITRIINMARLAAEQKLADAAKINKTAKRTHQRLHFQKDMSTPLHGHTRADLGNGV